jgi:hypothetical protein
MKRRKKGSGYRILAVCMVLAIVCVMLPVYSFAGQVDPFTIQLVVTPGVVDTGISGVATLTENIASPPPGISADILDGEAVFVGGVIEDDRTYILSISGMAAYEDYDAGAVVDPSLNDTYEFDISSLLQDITAPEITELEKTPDGWTNTSVTVTGKVTDSKKVDKIDDVYYSTVAAEYGTVPPANGENAVLDPVTGDFSFEIQTMQNQNLEKVYVWAVDAAGNISFPCDEIAVNIEKDAPTVTNIKIETTDASQTLNYLQFGTFSDDTVKVTVEAQDPGTLPSGVNTITLSYGGFSFAPEPVTQTGSGPDKWEAEFMLSLSDLTEGTLYTLSAVATDNAGNESLPKKPFDFAPGNFTQSDDFMLDQTEPEVTVTPTGGHNDGTKIWFKETDNIAFTVDLKDEGSGLNAVEVTVNGTQVLDKDILATDFAAAEAGIWSDALNTNLNTSLTGTEDIEIIVTVTDNAGNEKISITNWYADTTEPAIVNFEIEARDSSAPMDPQRSFLSYGTFFNDKVMVTVTGSDVGGSGVASVSLYEDGVLLASKQVDGDYKAVFELPAVVFAGGIAYNKTLTAKATDNVGNEMSAEQNPTVVNPQIKNNRLTIETIKPTISATVPVPAYTDGNSGNWYGGPVAFTVTAADSGSGIRSVEVSLNGQAITKDYTGKTINAAFYANQTFNQTFTIHTSQGVRAEDGSYKLTIKVVDNASNVTETTRVIYVDTAAPIITDFTFSAQSAQGSTQDVAVQKTNYGFYFKEDTIVTVTAQDPDPAAGIRSITYFTVDLTGGRGVQTTVNTADKAEFVIPADFKGQIFAKATDNVGHTPKDFVSPDNVIVESPSKHLEETHIRFDKADAPYTDVDGAELYAGDVAVGLTITDTFSGLRRVEWAVTAPYDTARNAGGSIDISENGVLTGNTDGWNTTKTERNLVTEIMGTVPVANNSNGITLWVKMTDRAGNTSEEAIQFSIDKTAPTISVTYDNNNPDREFSRIYKADRIATIVITERNFRAEDVEIVITNTDGTIPAVVGWTTAWNAADSDATTNTATVHYSADGDYTFDIRYSDRAGNAAVPFMQHEFTIDKTLPTITVTYDNNESENGDYYALSRTATVTITEHNFETSRIVITGTATDDGAVTAFPNASSWSSRGDVHTATIPYESDARYTFTIEYTDKAGNKAADFETHTFVVDQTAPTIEITGVADKSANKGDVIPVILFSDTNYDQSTASISLSGAIRNKVPLAGEFTGQHNGQVYTFDNFERTKDVDDIYTLSAELTDLAGNRTAQTITFSVNRFGSVYVLDETLQSIEGKYVQNEVDIIVTETNVDSLQRHTADVKITYNGIPNDLVSGEDYTVNRTGGEGTWSQYQYHIPKALFAGEGTYVVTLYSVDAAGNVNENIQESKEAEISFGIDKTPPAIVSIGLENAQQYPVDNLEAAVSVTDNLVLKDVSIYLNGEKISSQTVENQEFVVSALNAKQWVQIVATDAAGNESILEISDFLVTTSLFYRWYNNTPLFIGTLAGICGVVVLVIFLIRRAKVRAKA